MRSVSRKECHCHLRLDLHPVMVRAFVPRLRPELAILSTDLVFRAIVDLAEIFRLLFLVMASVGSLAVDFSLVAAKDFRPVSIARCQCWSDFSAARSLPAAGWICPAVFDSGCCSIGFAIAFATAGSAVDFDPGHRNYFAIAAGPDPVRLRRLVAVDLSYSDFSAEAVSVTALVSGAVSTAQSSFLLPPG